MFREMADEHPDADTGDVNFVLKEQEHADFKRKGADLFVERKISLVEAIGNPTKGSITSPTYLVYNTFCNILYNR